MILSENRPPPASSSGAGFRGHALAFRPIILDRLALGAHARDHRADLAHAHTIGNLDLKLLLIDHFGNLADKPSGSNHGIAAAQVLDQVLVLLHPLLLR